MRNEANRQLAICAAMKPKSDELRTEKDQLAKLANHFLHTNQGILNPYDAEIK
jgi:hypothetical protein